jgi:hypothetical protein
MNGFIHTGVGNASLANQYVPVSQLQSGTFQFAVGAGTAQAITAVYSPPNTALTDGMELRVRALLANTATAPTFAPDGLTAHPITKFGGKALIAGDIYGALHEMLLRYNLANTRWELLNPRIYTRNAYTSFTQVTPSGTTSATSLQMGLGSSWALTPQYSGRVRITVVGYSETSAAGNAGIDATYGTGAAPANGDAKTGTYFNNHDIIATALTTGTPAYPFCLISEAIGLTIGIPYWFDMTLASSAGTSSILINSVIIEEL